MNQAGDSINWMWDQVNSNTINSLLKVPGSGIVPPKLKILLTSLPAYFNPPNSNTKFFNPTTLSLTNPSTHNNYLYRNKMPPPRLDLQELKPAKLGNIAAGLGNLINERGLNQQAMNAFMTNGKKLLEFLKRPGESGVASVNRSNKWRVHRRPRCAPFRRCQLHGRLLPHCQPRVRSYWYWRRSVHPNETLDGRVCSCCLVLTLRRYTGRGFPICVLRRSHARWKPVCYFAIDGDAWNIATRGGRRRWWERCRGLRSCVGFGRRTRVKPGGIRMCSTWPRCATGCWWGIAMYQLKQGIASISPGTLDWVIEWISHQKGLPLCDRAENYIHGDGLACFRQFAGNRWH